MLVKHDIANKLKKYNFIQGTLVSFPEDRCEAPDILLSFPVKDIYFTDHLDTHSALKAIKSKARLLLAKMGGYACHGAVYLRAMSRKRNEKIWCISGMGEDAIKIKYSNLVVINKKGGIYFDGELSSNDPEKTINSPMEKWEIPGPYLRRTFCYWPERKLNKLDFSLRKKGLEISAKSIIKKPINCFQDSDGKVIFIGAPTLTELTQLACNPKASEPYLIKQIAAYDNILISLRDLDDIVVNWSKVKPTKELLNQFLSLFELYYSHFLLIHDTYHEVFDRCTSYATSIFENTNREWVLSKLLRCKTVDEFICHDTLPDVKKSINTLEPITHLPSILLDDEVKVETDRICEESKCRKTKKVNPELIGKLWDMLIHGTKILCIKERKFLLNKCLYTRFSRIASSLNYIDEESYNISFSTY